MVPAKSMLMPVSVLYLAGHSIESLSRPRKAPFSNCASFLIAQLLTDDDPLPMQFVLLSCPWKRMLWPTIKSCWASSATGGGLLSFPLETIPSEGTCNILPPA